MKQVVVVIPVYTEDLTSFERVSLAQVRKVLGRYDICFMAPDRMRTFLEGRGARAVSKNTKQVATTACSPSCGRNAFSGRSKMARRPL